MPIKSKIRATQKVDYGQTKEQLIICVDSHKDVNNE